VTSVPGEGSTFRVVLRGAVRTAGQSGRGLAAA